MKKDDRRFDTICLFLISGRTYTFRDVLILSDNETAITFRYSAMSDRKAKEATFYKTHVAGVSRCQRQS